MQGAVDFITQARIDDASFAKDFEAVWLYSRSMNLEYGNLRRRTASSIRSGYSYTKNPQSSAVSSRPSRYSTLRGIPKKTDEPADEIHAVGDIFSVKKVRVRAKRPESRRFNPPKQQPTTHTAPLPRL
jgi:hypothetical protein